MLVIGFEPTTARLQGECSASWATPAKYIGSDLVFTDNHNQTSIFSHEVRIDTSKAHHILVSKLNFFISKKSIFYRVRISYSVRPANSYSHFHDINLIQHLSLELHSYAIRSLY